ncbi:C6 zinc finger domain protein [Aspergillus fischeri NRRL 181]|uniref:C6 zinc finger domain protein n=1 Tax=Neosartorya fischeri (strain ATCC 1020 / DSM 3700 / CBS 544.65 / FGSC A1164 / JCM 1740 / NRRL 181 / WB 181) TaxID=331117 RepID=A1D0V5_NEOFI|nr:C6 zinc finger domain protein [Aspergillus fischeri NRRL 181]EAW24625.1 C6 zinc finger domain protein [Aspergillus fischeri NRRL 181]
MDSNGLAGHDTRRRRGALACNTCRGRRTKCDGQRPKCSFCAERGKECIYQEPQCLPASPLRAELSRLWDQLDHITAIVQGQIPQKFHFPNSRQSSPVTAGETPLGFPCMILQNGAFMKLLGLDTSLALYFEHTERGRQTVPAQPLQDGILMIDLDQASILLDAFTEQIHTWYPILHAEYSHDFVHAVTSGFPSSVSSCMTLLVLAIGCVVECENGVDALQTRPDAAYIQAAMEMLPCVFSDGSPRSAQCLLLFAIYYLCHAQPCQAHDFVAMASSKLQTYIMNEIRVQLDLVDSGIWNITPFAPAPTASGTWRWHINQPYGSPASSSSGSEIYPRNTDMSYFVAEIAMRKMLQRCTWATSTLAPGRYVYAPIVAAELERQLDEWLQLLPETLSFRRALDIGYRPRQNLLSISPQGEFLRTQYYAFKASIYWPAVYEVLTTGEANGDLLCHCARFFSSYAEFAPSAALAVAACRPNLWTLCTSVFTISMATLVALTEPYLVQVAAQGVDKGLEIAVKIFEGVTEVSPSLADMGAILRERVQCTALARRI